MKLAYEIHLPLTERYELAPIILIHGLIESRRTWKLTAPHIANFTGRKTYAIDIRNHGESNWDAELNCSVMSQDIAEFLSYHKISKAIIIGHSFGGHIAMSFALRWPEKVEKLILEDVSTKKFKAAPNGLITHAMILLKRALDIVPDGVDLITAKECIVNYMMEFSPDTMANKSKVKYYTIDMIPLRKNGEKFSWEADIERLIDLVSTDKIEHEFSGVYEEETLFLYGSLSFFKIFKDRRIPELFPKAVLKKIEGASHFIHSESPDIFVKNVVEFINSGTLHLQAKY